MDFQEIRTNIVPYNKYLSVCVGIDYYFECTEFYLKESKKINLSHRGEFISYIIESCFIFV